MIIWYFIAYSQWNNKGSSKVDCLIFYRLFLVFLRPSFGACAPPSPNSARNLNFLRRVGRLLMIFPSNEILSRRSAPLSPKGKAIIGTVRHSPRRGKQLSAQCATLPKSGRQLSTPRVTLPERKKRFPPSGKAFYFPTRLLNQNAGILFLFASIKTNRKTFNNIK